MFVREDKKMEKAKMVLDFLDVTAGTVVDVVGREEDVVKVKFPNSPEVFFFDAEDFALNFVA